MKKYIIILLISLAFIAGCKSSTQQVQQTTIATTIAQNPVADCPDDLLRREIKADGSIIVNKYPIQSEVAGAAFDSWVVMTLALDSLSNKYHVSTNENKKLREYIQGTIPPSFFGGASS